VLATGDSDLAQAAAEATPVVTRTDTHNGPSQYRLRDPIAPIVRVYTNES